MISTLLSKIVALVAIPVLFFTGVFAPEPVPIVPVEPLGVALPSGTATFETSLASPITNSATTMLLSSVSVRGGTTLSGYQCFAIDEGSAQAEFVCGTASSTSITGLERGLSPADGVTEVTTLKFSHRRGASVKITDFPLIQRLKSQAIGSGTYESVLSYASGVTPTGGSELVDVEYLTSVITGTSTLSYNKTIVNGTAGETVVSGSIVYLNPTDARWYKASASTTSTYQAKQLGIAQGAGTTAASISGGVLIYGFDSTQKAMTPGGTLWLSDTAGATSSATTTQALGQIVSATTLIFNPQVNSPATLGGGNFGTPSTTNKFLTERFQANVLNVQEFTASSTWTMPSYGNMVLVELWGAGGGGGGGERNSNPDGGKGGGGGAYIYKLYKRSDLSPTTTTVTIGWGGRGGAVNNQGTAGGNTTFGSYLTGYGGGLGTSGDSNYTGGGGGGWFSAGTDGQSSGQSHGGNPRIPYNVTTNPIYYDVNMGGGTGNSGDGGYAWYGGGAGGGGSSGTGGSSMFGGGGGGVGRATPGTAGGGYGLWQVGGGAAGCVGVGAAGSNGTFGQGGGGGCTGTGATAAGAGGNGGTAGGGGGGGEYDTDSGASAGATGGNGGNGFARVTVF